jgi:hypothetical protein
LEIRIGGLPELPAGNFISIPQNTLEEESGLFVSLRAIAPRDMFPIEKGLQETQTAEIRGKRLRLFNQIGPLCGNICYSKCQMLFLRGKSQKNGREK